MNPYINIQDIWATADEKSIHMMQKQKKKSKKKIFTHNVTTSSEESSSSDSDSSSEGSFVALRQEFRPSVAVRKSPAIHRRHVESVTSNQSAQTANVSSTEFLKDTYSNHKNSSPSANTFPAQYETSIKTVLPKSKENTALIKVDERKNQNSVTDDEVEPENTKKCVEIMNNESQLNRQYINDKFQINGKNSRVQGHSKKISSSTAPETSNYAKKADFQCITVSERVEVSKTRVIEIDVAKLSAIKNTTAENKNDVPKFQKKIENIKKHPKNRIKSEVCTNYRKNIKTFSQNNLTNLFKEEECVKWNNSLELNSMNQISQSHSMVTTTTGGVKSKNNTNSKIKWTTTRQENTHISVTKPSDKNNTTRQLTFNNKIKDIHYSQKRFIGSSISKNKMRQVKLDDIEIDVQDNRNPNTFLKQNRGQIIWETTCHPRADFHRNSSGESDVEESFNKKLQWNYAYKDGKEDNHNTSYTTLAQNRKTCCCGDSNNEQKFEGIKGIDTEETKYDHFENWPHQTQHDLISERKLLNSKQPKSLLDLGQKNPLIEFGKEISDLIVGSHVAISTFFSFYAEWKLSRCELIYQFEQLDTNIVETSKQYKKYQDMFKVLNGLALATANIPIPYISMASKIVSFFSGLATQFFGKSDGTKIDMDVPEILTSLFRDMDASSELYMYGLQCNQQLEETTKLIEKFHSSAVNHEFDDECSDKDILAFMRGIVEYNPKHHTFYKKLHKSFQELLRKESPLCVRFCEPFQFGSSNSVDVVGYLDWRFVNINNESVKNELEQIHFLIQNNSSTAMSDLAARMKNCIRILKDELKSANRCVSQVSLFQTSFETLKLDSK